MLTETIFAGFLIMLSGLAFIGFFHLLRRWTLRIGPMVVLSMVLAFCLVVLPFLISGSQSLREG